MDEQFLYRDLGFLILGSRLRRMSEYFLSEVNRVYQQQGFSFEAGWFPLFFILARGEPVSLRAVADELMISHSAVSQLVKHLKEKKLVETIPSELDKRSLLLQLTEKGTKLRDELQPVWLEISKSLQEMEKIHPAVAHFLPALADLESHFEKQSLSSIISANLEETRLAK
ncbi:MAG TPA: helix-turn-helix domain-containing protein [Arachidicoccus sp.]|nr:helix-turn-helix domain-containing protein [Arachidicoccus sp.]